MITISLTDEEWNVTKKLHRWAELAIGERVKEMRKTQEMIVFAERFKAEAQNLLGVAQPFSAEDEIELNKIKDSIAQSIAEGEKEHEFLVEFLNRHYPEWKEDTKAEVEWEKTGKEVGLLDTVLV